jgi:hypothetical protein
MKHPQHARIFEHLGGIMPNWCDCKLTIKGPNRQAILYKIKGDEVFVEQSTDINDKLYMREYIVYFDVDKVIPRPKEVAESEGWADWGCENWGCRNVYPDLQKHVVHDDSDVIYFYTPWSPPLYAIHALSAMFPENSFLLEDDGMDLPSGTTLFRGGIIADCPAKAHEDISGLEVKTIA